MPPVSRWFIRAALGWLLGGLAGWLGVALLAPAWLGAVRLGLFHALTVGWITQLIFGVALWLFPKHPGADPRGPAALNWLAFAGLNAGVPLRAVSEPWLAQAGPASWAAVALTLAAWLQLAACTAMAVSLWPRIR